jgi:sulfur transfer complex TusBCD TusB component (DsrH family)
MTLEERIKQMLAESEKEDTVVEEFTVVAEETAVVPSEPAVAEPAVVAEEKRSAVSDQVSALLEAEGLSEEFKLQAVTIFEAAVSDRVMQIEEELKQEYQEALDEATAEMEKNIDGFMSEAIQQWMIDNKLAVETNFKHKLQESFIDGLTALLAEHNIELPAESENALDVALDQITSLEESIESASAREAELMEQIADMKATSILESFRSKMPATTFDRFVQLTENINYTDETQYARQLDIVYENFGKVTAVVESAPARQITESIAQPAVAEDLNESVEFYAQYMSK